MLRDKYPDIYESQSLLTTYCNRIMYNYGFDIGLLRGVPIVFDAETQKAEMKVETITKINRVKSIREAATLELIFTHSSGSKDGSLSELNAI